MHQTDIRSLAIAQFRKDWPFMADRLDAMREKAARALVGAADTATASAASPSPRPVTRGESTATEKGAS